MIKPERTMQSTIHEKVAWRNLKQDDVGEAHTTADVFPRKRVIEVSGNFSGKATLRFCGGIERSDYELTDDEGLPALLTRPGMMTIDDTLSAIYPMLDGGNQDTDVTVVMLVIM